MALPVKNDTHQYGLGSIAIHWGMALIIIGMYPLGLYIDTLDYYDPAYRTVPQWHKSIGLILMSLLIVRMLWQTINKKPQALEQPKLLLLITKLAHSGLYLLLLIALVSGYMISTADGRAIAVFNWFEVPALPAVTENQEDIAGEIHYLSTTTLIILAGLHALAALKHHYINKDNTLKRMLGMHQETNS
ncbi:cytochrome b [Amphritea balenae]|uniref:Cytochrome b n=1 Tax=Amphritea balenae TaxID=452629 RepID=A0A3P1SWM9_9GAMM|nr:cytochrome b [Amphritea balenae]RRD01385.1 cytochrome b [Amphritea balenae]